MASFNQGYLSPRTKPFRAVVQIDNKKYFLGSYRSRYEAEKVEEEFRVQTTEKEADVRS